MKWLHCKMMAIEQRLVGAAVVALVTRAVASISKPLREEIDGKEQCVQLASGLILVFLLAAVLLILYINNIVIEFFLYV